MASMLRYVLENFYWRIQAITPSYVGPARAVERFEPWDPQDGRTPTTGSGWTRKFWVERIGSGQDTGATSDVLRESEHIYHTHVLYDNAKHRRTQAIICDDRDNLAKVLRGVIGTNYRLGYDDDNSTTDIGLMKRWRGDDRTIDYLGDSAIKQVTTEWYCSVREDET